MNRLIALFSALALLPSLSLADDLEDLSAVECFKSASFLAPLDSADRRKYAPDRDVEILHLALDVTPDFKQRNVHAIGVTRFRPIAKPAPELKLDAVDLRVDSVSSTEKIRAWQVSEDKIVITFDQPIPVGKEADITISWSAEPKQGLYFRTPEMGYPETDTHLFTQGEEIEARHWYPCFDSPNAKFTSEITCHLPAGMTSISNGRLLSEQNDPASGLVTFHWSQEKPHANYLISLVAGRFQKLEDRHRDVPLTFYTPPSEFAQASNSFRDTKEIMAFFEDEIGVPYPWPKYAQTCVSDFVAGGMENTSCTTLTDNTLFTDATENIRNSEGLVAHEMAHQWFGDYVTCKDWSHTWLNEGFATYYETLFNGHKHGRDAMLYELYGRTRQITGLTNTDAIVRRTYEAPREMFNYLAYPKGSWVLHMLRAQLGDDLYRRCIKTYLERHAYGNVVTEDLRAVIEELSGRSFDQFFDQWLYHGYHPEIQATYSWDEPTRLAKISISQNQKTSDGVLLFKFPLKIRFKGKCGTTERTIDIKQRQEDFYFPLECAPEVVRLDPDYTLLAKISFTLPTPMLYAQLADKDDAIGRILAIDQLGDKQDKETVAKLKQVLNDDPFYGARVEASRALRQIHSDEARDALLASTTQSDARVRHGVIGDIAGFYAAPALQSALKTAQNEKNPDIQAAALRALGGYSKPEAHETLLTYLKSQSFHNELAEASIGGIRSQDDPTYITAVLDVLSKTQNSFTARGYAQALDALAYLARNEEKKDNVREFLVAHVTDPRERIQIGAISALGILGDAAALSVVERFATATKESPEQRAAERATLTLREGRKPVDDFKNLRQEVLDLQKAERELRKELDTLKKTVQARQTTNAPPTKKSTTSKPK
jgi:aminopeptidase N